jgi:hypothetical protein
MEVTPARETSLASTVLTKQWALTPIRPKKRLLLFASSEIADRRRTATGKARVAP